MEICLFAQHSIQLDSQLDQKVTIITETDSRNLMHRNMFHTDDPVAKSVIRIHLQQRGDLLPGESATVIKDIHTGGSVLPLM